MDSNSNIYKCKFTNLDILGEDHKCKLHGQRITEDTCELCKQFKSKYIEYPIEVSNINIRPIDIDSKECGTLVAVRPCDDEYKNKTFIGILLGDLPIMNSISYNETDKELTINSVPNPAIFVPELRKIIFGMESWWFKVDNLNDIKDITDEDIENLWYVKMLKNQNK